MNIIGQTHIGVFVKDLQRSCDFYRDILKFDIEWIGDLDDPEGIFHIALARNHDLILEIVQPPVLNDREQAGSVDHIAVKTDNVYGAFEEMKALGFTPLSDAVVESDTIFGTGGKWFFILGPDHERIEIAQG